MHYTSSQFIMLSPFRLIATTRTSLSTSSGLQVAIEGTSITIKLLRYVLKLNRLPRSFSNYGKTLITSSQFVALSPFRFVATAMTNISTSSGLQVPSCLTHGKICLFISVWVSRMLPKPKRSSSVRSQQHS